MRSGRVPSTPPTESLFLKPSAALSKLGTPLLWEWPPLARLVGIFAPAPGVALWSGEGWEEYFSATDKVAFKKRKRGIGIAREEMRF